jgi:hypothetical protein
VGKKEVMEKVTYEDYVRDRKMLSDYEQKCYESYEKTIITLSSAFLAFSVSFLALLRGRGPAPNLVFSESLIASWVVFGASILFMLLSFWVSALANRKEVAKLERRLEKSIPKKLNCWTVTTYVLYIFSGATFVVGIVLLLIFCVINIKVLF